MVKTLPEGFVASSTPHAEFMRDGDILFTIGDVPVIVEEIALFKDGSAACRVRYIGIAFRSGTVGVESLGDLMTETHDEMNARWKADNFASVGTWPKPRNIEEYSEQAILRFNGVSQKRYAEFMETMARSAKQGAL